MTSQANDVSKQGPSIWLVALVGIPCAYIVIAASIGLLWRAGMIPDGYAQWLLRHVHNPILKCLDLVFPPDAARKLFRWFWVMGRWFN